MLQNIKKSDWRLTSYHLSLPPGIHGSEPDIYVSVMGRFFSFGRFRFHQIPHGFAMHIVKSGRGSMDMNGGKYTIKEGDAFTFFPGKRVYYNDFPESPWRFTWVTFAGSKTRDILADIGVTESNPHISGNLHDLNEPVFKEIEEVYRQDDIPFSFSISAAWQIIDNISRKRPRLKPTIKTYLDSARIEMAKHLLRFSGSPNKEISSSCGYKNEQYFCRAFKKHTGSPPVTWKKKDLARRKTDSP